MTDSPFDSIRIGLFSGSPETKLSAPTTIIFDEGPPPMKVMSSPYDRISKIDGLEVPTASASGIEVTTKEAVIARISIFLFNTVN